MFSIGTALVAGSPRRIWLGVCSILLTSLLVGINAQAQSIVNKNAAGGAAGVTSVTVTLPSVSSGNLINIGVGWCGGGTSCNGTNASSNTMTVTDSAGNTLTVPSGATLTGVPLASSIAQGIVTAASSSTDTFTIHFSSAVDYPQVSVSQISPPSGFTFSGADGSGTTANTTGTSLTLSLTTSNAEDLLYSFTWDETFNAGSGQTVINQRSSDGVTDSYLLVTSSGSHSMSYSLSGSSGPESGSMAAYKLSSGGGCTPSASGTTIPSASSITDSSCIVWTVSGGKSYENGTADNGANIALLLYYNGTIYAQLTASAGSGWWEHTPSAGWFAISGDPRGSSEGPYGGSPAAIPGTVMAENYDTGGQGVGYSVSSVNGTNNGYRSDGVDLEAATSPATGNDLGWTAGGQWFRYTVDVYTAGTFTVSFLVASPSGVTDGFHLANSSGTNLTGSVNVPNTGAWQSWTTVTASVTLPAGVQTLTLSQDNSGWNIDNMVFSSGSGGIVPYGVSPPSGKSWVLTFDDEFTQESSSIQTSYPPSGQSLTTSEGTWSWGVDYGGSPAQWAILLNGNGVAAGAELELIGGQLYLNDVYYSWWVRQSGSWVSTTDPNIGVGPVNTGKWNGGAGNTDWCDASFWGKAGGTYMFGENPSNPCGQFYDGLSLSSTNGLSMQSFGGPSAALQTAGSSTGNALFMQQYGYWEASFEVPSANDGEGGIGNHSDFWMHAMPEGEGAGPSSNPSECSGLCLWGPEFDIGERPTWNQGVAAANTQISFSIDDNNGTSTGGLFSAPGSPDLSAGFHKYGLSWLNDGSGPYGSMQIYLDGVALLGSRWVLSSSNPALANGIYMYLSNDNDGVGTAQPFNVQYVRVWQAQ